MLAEAAGVKKIYIACGYTDLRKGIDGLATMGVRTKSWTSLGLQKGAEYVFKRTA